MSPSRLNQLASLAAAAGLALSSAGCSQDSTSSTGVPEVSIDTGVKLVVKAGQLQGVFVEYAGAGAWNVYTSCDTVADGNACAYDIILSTSDPKRFSGAAGTNLGPTDSVTSAGDGSLHLVFNTSSALDGVTFSTTAGAVLEVDASLNGAAAPQLVNWITGGAVRNGAPANPCDFDPTTP